MLLKALTREQSVDLYMKVLKDNDYDTMRRLCLEDLNFLLVIACKRKDLNRDWIYARIREVESNPDGNLDLWFREAGKSSVITFGMTIKDILNNPELTFGIFSHTRPIAKSFLVQIAREFETNTFLQDLFPDVLYKEPQKESPRWSLDGGIVVKRKGNPKEATIEAFGLVDGQPTSKHFNRLIFDDVVTKESVSTPEMIAKVTEAFSLSLNLAGADCKKRFIGTRYHQNDTYATIIERGTAKPRIYPATHDGTINGNPVLLSREQLDEKLRDVGSYVFSAQMLMNPASDKAMGFKTEWLQFFDQQRRAKMNVYILVDAAREKKDSSDYTVMTVVGLGEDNNYYVLDAIRDRLNLTERTKALFGLVRKWKPLRVGYERYGLMSDTEHIKYVQEQEGYRFSIIELGGSMAKNDRIRKLVPAFEDKRFYIARTIPFITADGKVKDFVQEFIKDEYSSFPVCNHDDMLDCLSRIMDNEFAAVFPKTTEGLPLAYYKESNAYDPLKTSVNVLEVSHA